MNYDLDIFKLPKGLKFYGDSLVVRPFKSNKPISLLKRYYNIEPLPYNSDFAQGYLLIDSSVNYHSDDGGKCFLYMIKGHGVFHTETKSIPITAGYCLSFNDRHAHAFTLNSRTAAFLIVNYNGIIKTELPNYLGFIK